ncbi:hypothetical protein [Micromonospora sp. NPDC047730]|uniref:hypothetical protein n=1 Tax=Micromonospora sp. NPDC047730 TaxID=3364253 RepID=UPI00372266F2
MRRILTTAAIVALLAIAGCGGDQQEKAAADRSPSPATTTASPTPSPSPSPSPSTATPTTSPPAPPSPTPAWTPCDLEREFYEGGCDDDFISGDACDASYYSQQVGSLIDAYIENRIHVDAARLKDCPQFLPTWKKAQTGMEEGSFEVGKEVKPGTYQTTAHLIDGKVTDCYWERTGSNGRIIANDFITATTKVRVTIRSSDEMFTSRNCGNWIRV